MNERRSFYRDNHVIKFKKNESIFLQFETPRCLYCIKSGIVVETNLTHSGNRQSISYDIVGDIIPKCWAFSRTSKTLFEYRAFSNCELYVIDKGQFLSQLSDNLDFVDKMLDRSVRSLISANLHIDVLEKPDVKTKLLYTFRFLGLLYGSHPENESVKILIPFTQQDIAEFSGLTRETTNVELNKLKRAGFITCKRKYYTVNTKKITDKIDDEYNPGMSENILHLDTHLISRI
jgi:CRP-like cAMP-binding protein